MTQPLQTIEPALATDCEAISQLLAAQLDEHDIELPTANLTRAVKGFFDDPRRGRILVARNGESVIGVAVLSYSWTLERGGQTCWLDELYVNPEWRNHGIGKSLVRKAIELTTNDGCISMELEVESGHERAANLYQREGFLVHSRTRYYRHLQES
jgi:ribosomal protein S18 acetylase RimI-like enzyme